MTANIANTTSITTNNVANTTNTTTIKPEKAHDEKGGICCQTEHVIIFSTSYKDGSRNPSKRCGFVQRTLQAASTERNLLLDISKAKSGGSDFIHVE